MTAVSGNHLVTGLSSQLILTVLQSYNCFSMDRTVSRTNSLEAHISLIRNVRVLVVVQCFQISSIYRLAAAHSNLLCIVAY